LDLSFNPGTGAGGGVYSIALQSDGKVLIGGYFNAVNGTNRNGIARLNANGSLDIAFNPGTGTGANGAVFSLALHQMARCSSAVVSRSQWHKPQQHRPAQCQWQSGWKFQSA